MDKLIGKKVKTYDGHSGIVIKHILYFIVKMVRI